MNAAAAAASVAHTGGEPGRLTARGGRGVERAVDGRDRDVRLGTGVERPFVAEAMLVRRQARGDAARRERPLRDRPEPVVGGAVDEQQVEPVADAEAIRAVAHQALDVGLGGARVEVEHPAAVGMREDPVPAAAPSAASRR